MASAKILLYTSKILSNGEHPIMMRIIKDRKPKYVATGKSCSKELWDHKTNRPKSRHPYKRELDILINTKLKEADKTILGYESDEKYFSSEVIKNKLKKNFSKITVFQCYDLEIDKLEKASRIGYANVFKDSKRALVNFRKGKDLMFVDITVRFLNDFEAWFSEKGVAGNSISVYMRALRKIMNSAISEGYCPPEVYPFKAYNISKLNTATDKRAITKEQIKKIIEVEVKEDSRLFHSKSYFLFSFYNMGMNFTDMAFLKWTDIREDRLYYKRAKTRLNYNIKLLLPALEILKYYKENYSSSLSNFVFPILNESHATAKSISYRIEKVLRHTNSDLKEIGKVAGLEVPLTTYVARHSWATILKRAGTKTSVISEGLGHTTEKTTQIYLDSFENETLDEANKALL
jgi:integrase